MPAAVLLTDGSDFLSDGLTRWLAEMEPLPEEEITDRAGVNQGLIYFYFESKADIFLASFEHHARLVLAQLDTVFEQEHDEDPATDLTHLLQQIITVLDTPNAINLLRMMHQIASSRTPRRSNQRPGKMASCEHAVEASITTVVCVSGLAGGPWEATSSENKPCR